MKQQHWRIGATLTKEQRKVILETFAPKYSNVHAKGLTYAYKVAKNFEFPDAALDCRLYGYHVGDGHDAILVAVGPAGLKQRPDKKFFHITLSVANGVPPAQAGNIERKNIQPLVWPKFDGFPTWLRLAGPLNLANSDTFSVRFQRLMLRVTQPQHAAA